MASEKRMHNVNLLVAWGGTDTKNLNVSVPFPCRKVVIKPIIYNFTDNGGAPAPYIHARITCNMLSDNNGAATIGIILPKVYSTGGMPIAGFSYMFDSPTIVNGFYNFRAVALNGATLVTLPANDSLICMEFYEA